MGVIEGKFVIRTSSLPDISLPLVILVLVLPFAFSFSNMAGCFSFNFPNLDEVCINSFVYLSSLFSTRFITFFISSSKSVSDGRYS